MDSQVATIVNVQTKSPPNREYGIFIYNDDITPFELVVTMLVEVLKKSEVEALTLTMIAQNKGLALVDKLPKKLALARVNKAKKYMTENGFPKFKINIREV